jgi:hypothetical protein
MARRIIPHAPDGLLAATILEVGEIAFAETSRELRLGDGETVGGFPVGNLGSIGDGVGGFLFSSFRGDNELQGLDLFYSADGFNLYRLNGGFVDNPGEVRDPSMFLADDGYWYYFRTVGYRSATFEVRRSVEKNLVSGFKSVAFVDCRTAERPDIVTAWAPSAFRHPQTGVWYAEVALADNSDETLHNMAYVEFTSPDFTTWNPPASYGMGVNYIDGETVFEGGLFHMFVKNEAPGSKYIERWTSPAYPNPGGWTQVNAGDWLGFSVTGTTVEGVTLAKRGAQWFLYADANSLGIPFVTTSDKLAGPWTIPQPVSTFGAAMRHFFAIPLDTPVARSKTSEAASVLSLGKIAELAPSARPAVPLAAALGTGWTANFPAFGDAAPSGYASLSGEVSWTGSAPTGEDAIIIRLPAGLANANPKRFLVPAANGAATASLFLYKGFLIWQAGSTDRIDLGSITYIIDGTVTGLNPG